MSDSKKAKTVNEKEVEVLSFWKENKIFEKSVETPADGEPIGDFSFYDGPPFATGLPHFGHILAGTIKDAIPRYETMNGKRVRRVWGWDCHGLPIENLIEKKLNLSSKKDIEEYGIDKFNKEAYESVLTYDKEWKDVIPRFGRFVDMEHPYKTMDATYTESIWWAWKELHNKGLAYEGNKMMHICPRCETPLAQSEVGMNYEDVTDISVTAKFELVDEPNTFILAWTTTPWTLPGNVALAIGKDIDYVKVESVTEGVSNNFIVAKDRMEDVFKNSPDHKIVDEFKGEKLIGKAYKSLFNYFEKAEIKNKENIYKIWGADFVTTETGTGVVHIAPAFGEDDMNLAKENNLPIIKHVKMNGEFTEEVTDFAGMKVKKVGDTQSADIEIIKWLAHNGKLFAKEKLIHSYPLCWRCKTPLLNYATSSWFVDVPKMKEKLLSENSKIGWTPEHIRDGRFGKWLEGAREWAVSRTRYWGAPLPVWKSENEVTMIGSLVELAERNKQKPKNTYYVMRHGQANSNVFHMVDKGNDTNNHLTEDGKFQVEKQKDYVKDLNIDVMFSSPVIRAKETAEIIKDNKEVIFDNRLSEDNAGIYDGKDVGVLEKEVGKKYLQFNYTIEGGESHQDVMNRVMSVIMDCEKNYTNKNILFVTHGSPARMMIVGSELLTEESILAEENIRSGNLYLDNAEIRKINYKIVPRDETGAVNLHRPYIDEVVITDSKGEDMKRIPDVFDCWFESGSMPFASIHYPFENKKLFEKSYPAEFIAEGMDQTRGWFYSLINLGVGLFDKAPYKNVIVNGLVLAEGGKKLSKSENNFTDPMELAEKFGVDAIRFVLLSSPVVKGENISFSDDMVEESYKKIILRMENVLSLYEMNKTDNVKSSSDSKNILDRWIISRINEVIKSTTAGYQKYCLDEATRPVDQFVDDLSVWFVRRSRSRLKGDEGENEKVKSSQTLKFVLIEFAKVTAPVMPFLSERIYKTLDGEKESVHLESWPKGGNIDTEVITYMKEAREIVSVALMKRTESKIAVRQPLQTLYVKTELGNEYLEIIKDEVNVKEIKKGEEVSLDINLTDELIKEGDIRNLMRAIQDVRKEKGLSPKDIVNISVSSLSNFNSLDLLKATCKIGEIKEDKNIEGTTVKLSFGDIVFSIN